MKVKKRYVVVASLLLIIGCGHRRNRDTRYDSKPTLEIKETDTKQEESKPVVTETKEEEKTEKKKGISKEFKKQMDSYEAFFDSYITFMHKYQQDPSNLELLSEYIDFLSKYETYMDELDRYDEADLSEEEWQYYLEVQLRIEGKLLKAMQ